MKRIMFLAVMSIGVMALAQEKKEGDKTSHHYFDKRELKKAIKNAKKSLNKLDKEKIEKSLEKAQIGFDKAKEAMKEFGYRDPHKFLEETKIKRILEELKIPEKDREETRKLFEQYFQQKNDLIKQFKKEKKKVEELSNEEARERIRASFETAQKMLDMRKEYTEIFLKKFTPQEVIKIHQIEKNMMDFVKKKHEELKQKQN